MIRHLLAVLLLVFTSFAFAAEDNNSESNQTNLRCPGEFANPITDICWSCIFPISMGGMPLWTGGQEDNRN
ncbi:TraU family protein, partial [Acinetobacter baumannii]